MMNPRALLALLALVVLVLLPGCVAAPTGKHWWSPRTWFSSTPAATVTAAAAKVDTAERAAVVAARAEVAKTGHALAAAPASRPVEVAIRTNATAQSLLDQVAGPMPAAEAAELRKLAADLLSENAAIRADAEDRQAKAESAAAAASARLAKVSAELAAANGRLLAAYGRENALADTLRNERALRAWLLGGGTLLALLLGAGWLWVRITAGGIPQAIGTLLRDLDEKHPDQAANLRSLLDPVLNRLEQAAIRKAT